MSVLGWTVAGLATVLALYAAAVLALVVTGRRTDARALAGIVPDCAVLLRRLARERRLSWPRRVALAACAGYLLFPIDLIPDAIPVAGQVDDAIVVAIGLRIALRGGSAAAIVRNWPGPRASLRIILWLAGMNPPAKALR
jgi:uncharacterized membrane protein YkvA (DUF1232 family)